MNYIICILLGIFALITCYVSLDKIYSGKVRFFHVERAEKEIVLSKTQRMIIWSIFSLAVVFSELRMLREGINNIDTIKINIALICMVGAGCIDLREERIPNVFPGTMALGAVIVHTVSFFVSENASAYIASSIFATVVSALGLAIVYLVSRKGIGLGDIKLICALAMMCGVYILCYTLLLGIIFSGIVGILLIVSKKRTLQGSLPFGPFLYIGFVITIIFTNF